MMTRFSPMLPGRLSIAITTGALALAPRLGAQTTPAPAHGVETSGAIVGFTAPDATRERAAEARVAAMISPTSADSLSRALSREPHMSGTPAQARTRDIVMRALASYGITPEVRTYSIYMPHPTSVHLYRVAPQATELPLAEGPVPEDTTSWAYPQLLAFNGYGAAGDATGDVVYVNYGLVQDYRTLDSLGISVKGKIVLARYGHSYRGIKAREAEKHGAAALIIYSDPADDGYDRGDVYPEGPMRPPQGLQRGSVFNDNGDPTTPGYPSLPGAKRVPLSETTLPRIPVIPTSYRNAAALLRDVRGTAALPRGWQGGMPFRYHIGPGPVRARVVVTTDAATHPYKDIWDVLGTVRGTRYPDQLVIIGGHRDAWGPGADDNVSGTVSMLESARMVGALLRQGWRPKRTIVFASWDAEEWGLMGSTEYVEQDSAQLSRNGAAYFNFDMVVGGPAFGASGAPSLRPFLRDVTKSVRSPGDTASVAGHTVSVYDAWRHTARLAADSAEPQIGDPGGGSDFAGFYNHLGIPIMDWGFNGPEGIYHSAYDSYHWVAKFGDPGFHLQATMGVLGAVALMRAADADILPYDYVAYAQAMRALSATAAKNIAAKKWHISTAPLDSAIGTMEVAARAFGTARDASLARGPAHGASADSWKQANATLLRVERVFVRPEGLPVSKRAWFRNVIYAADNDNGYANIGLPSINEAVQSDNEALTTREISDLAARFRAAAALLNEAARSLR